MAGRGAALEVQRAPVERDVIAEGHVRGIRLGLEVQAAQKVTCLRPARHAQRREQHRRRVAGVAQPGGAVFLPEGARRERALHPAETGDVVDMLMREHEQHMIPLQALHGRLVRPGVEDDRVAPLRDDVHI